MILAVNTSEEEALLQIIDDSGEVIKNKQWQAGRHLISDLAHEFEEILNDKEQIKGLIVFSGPGSFTGLRIGVSMMNALAYSLEIPLVGTSGNNWLELGLKRLKNHENDRIVTPNYGREANITQPKK